MIITPLTRMTPVETLERIGESQQQAGMGSSSQVPFADMLKDAMSQYQEAKEISDQDSYDLAMGNTDNIASVMIHSLQTSTAMEMTVQLASRAVSTYKEIMQMQV